MGTLFPEASLDPASFRQPDHPCDPLFVHRWSPRAFDPTPLPQGVVDALFEAARWAPSSFNEQPWRILYATPEDPFRSDFESLLTPGNAWAERAPLLGFFFARRRFSKNDKPNRVALFDCGSAWMSLTLQARMLGLYTHGMGGIDVEASYRVLGVPEEDFQVICAFAAGAYGDPSELPEDKRVKPNARRPTGEIAIRGPMLRS